MTGPAMQLGVALVLGALAGMTRAQSDEPCDAGDEVCQALNMSLLQHGVSAAAAPRSGPTSHSTLAAWRTTSSGSSECLRKSVQLRPHSRTMLCELSAHNLTSVLSQ
eukprot:CAMPEP_0179089986 /NCGR_PEP_ID=MMETSP0796-20121207/41030_1 /TAXON_ID=73915 /ORGANISM="Pyrodinium bahamense, Strain pbaha01" /LENGTH=106 /DNA_ID=CAMNT_0020787549 /DNA_START=68 /DNA_END=385 /DNA_ORIENTATION=+